MFRIHVEEEGLEELKEALATAGEQYKLQLAKLTDFIDEITRGDIQGDLADDLLEKYIAKKEDFQKLQNVIDTVEEKVGVKGADFVQMINDLKDKSK